MLSLLGCALAQDRTFSWNGGREPSQNDTNENGDLKCLDLFSFLRFWFCCCDEENEGGCFFSLGLYSVSDGWGVLWLLSDAATDVEDGDVLQHESKWAAEGPGESSRRFKQYSRYVLRSFQTAFIRVNTTKWKFFYHILTLMSLQKTID